jgi:hypothetical protein
MNQHWRYWHSAPKDGTVILGYFPRAEVKTRFGTFRQTKPHITMIRWWSPGEIAGNDFGGDKRKFLEEKQGGYWGGIGRRARPTMGVPSHWMPLPEPPRNPNVDIAKMEDDVLAWPHAE